MPNFSSLPGREVPKKFLCGASVGSKWLLCLTSGYRVDLSLVKLSNRWVLTKNWGKWGGGGNAPPPKKNPNFNMRIFSCDEQLKK